MRKDLARHAAGDRRAGPRRLLQGPAREEAGRRDARNGGIINAEGPGQLQAFEDEPIHVNYRGYDVYECPPNSQGHTMLQALNILEGFNLRYMGHNSAAYLHVVTESIKLAFADRNQYVADPAFIPEHPDARAAVEGVRGAAAGADRPEPRHRRRGAAGDPARKPRRAGAARRPTPAAGRAGRLNPRDHAEDGLTTYLTVVDKDHNMVSLTSSLLSGFGSGRSSKARG